MALRRTKTTSRAPVTRERAVRVAVGLADADGIESLSMRKLARELGVEAMSLYYHVKGKEDLLDGMVDVVFGEMALPPADTDWKAAMRERAESARSVLVQHQWAISLLEARTRPGTATLKYHDAVIECLRDAGFSMSMAAHAMSLLDSYVHGFALQVASLPFDNSGDIRSATENIMGQQEMMADVFPYLSEMAVTHILKPGYSYGEEFQFGLRVVLDGIETAHASDAFRARTHSHP